MSICAEVFPTVKLSTWGCGKGDRVECSHVTEILTSISAQTPLGILSSPMIQNFIVISGSWATFLVSQILERGSGPNVVVKVTGSLRADMRTVYLIKRYFIVFLSPRIKPCDPTWIWKTVLK